jgi:hypothetical protein
MLLISSNPTHTKSKSIYVTSTKKQKMLISRSIVEKIRQALSPPGRFLERDNSGSAWKEVDTKKALEKTAQALRDGAYPLRKQLSEDFSDSGFLEAVFDDVKADDAAAGATSETKPSASLAPHPLRRSYATSNSQTKGHRRRVSAPVLQKLPEFSIDELPNDDDRDSKRSKPNSPIWNQGSAGTSDGILTGVNFPSPGVSSEREFLIGTNHTNTAYVDTAGRNATKKHHRRNRTFGGYSCSDRHVSDINVDGIFALFMGNSSEIRQRQLESGMNGLDDEVNELFRSHSGVGTELNSDNDVMANGAAAGSSPLFDLQQIETTNNCHFEQQNQKQSAGNGMDAHLNQLFSDVSQTHRMMTTPSPIQQDTMMYSSQASPSLMLHENNLELPYLLGQQQHHEELSELNLMTTPDWSFNNNVNKTLSGAKRHRRYNTIASGHCFSTGNSSSNTASSGSAAEFNLDFLNNLNNNAREPFNDESNAHQSNNNYGSAHEDRNLHFLDFSNVHNVPVQDNNAASQSRMNGRQHRRTRTTGNIIGLPQDWNTSVGLNTIHEEVTTSIPLMNECGSLMSGEETRSVNEMNGSSVHAILDSFPATVGKGHTRDLSSKSSLSNHTRDMSSKSSLSNEDFCAHLMAGENWDGVVDADSENDGFMVSSVE